MVSAGIMRGLHERARTVIGAVAIALSVGTLAHANSLTGGTAAFGREDYVTAARLLGPLAERGVATAQTHLGFMFANGRGVPQSYVEAAKWYCRAASQADANAQYMLGLMFDKGQGVTENRVEAHKWLNLAAAHAPRSDREDWVRIRDAVASKMTLAQLAEARQRAIEWRPWRNVGRQIVPANCGQLR
jgi:TPR repeat protein